MEIKPLNNYELLKAYRNLQDLKHGDGGNIGDVESKRYVVSITNKELNADLSFKTFLKAYSKLLDTAKELNTETFIGYWKQQQKLYFDLNTSDDDKNTALILAKVFKQIAIYDAKSNAIITLSEDV